MKQCKDCKWQNKKFVYGCAHPVHNCYKTEMEHYTPKWYIKFMLWRAK